MPSEKTNKMAALTQEFEKKKITKQNEMKQWKFLRFADKMQIVGLKCIKITGTYHFNRMTFMGNTNGMIVCVKLC